MSVKLLIAGVMLLAAIGISAEEVRWPPPPNGFSSSNPGIPKGNLSNSINYPTRNYNNRACRVYTPPGYSESRAEKYPVLYLHHGIGGNEHAWTSNNGHAEGNADKVMDFLYAQEELAVTPMIVVMPMGNMTGTSGDAWQNFEDVLINDLAPYIEENYNASSDANMRAIAGLSMGGGQTLNFGYRNPDFFTWIGAFSPAPNTTSADRNIRDIEAVKANIHLNFMAAGTAESMYLNTARNYHNYLDQQGVDNLYLQVEQGLNHERENWNRQLHNFAQRIFKGITEIKRKEDIRLVTDANRGPIQLRNGVCLTPSSIAVYRSGNSVAGSRIFSLNGRLMSQTRPERTGLQTFGHIGRDQ